MSLDLDGIEADYVEHAINNREIDEGLQDMVDEVLNTIDNMLHPSHKQLKTLRTIVTALVKSGLLMEDLKRGL